MSSSLVSKPRSMTSGARNMVRSNDSASLWNCTLSPGWSIDEMEILRLAIMKFGVGCWTAILESGCLPGKTVAQMNTQGQRMLGQQSTAEFAGICLDVLIIGEMNSKKEAVTRKNNIIINTGNKLSREEIKQRLEQHRRLYEISQEERDAIVLPKSKIDINLPTLLEEKKRTLKRLREELEEFLEQRRLLTATDVY